MSWYPLGLPLISPWSWQLCSILRELKQPTHTKQENYYNNAHVFRFLVSLQRKAPSRSSSRNPTAACPRFPPASPRQEVDYHRSASTPATPQPQRPVQRPPGGDIEPHSHRSVFSAGGAQGSPRSLLSTSIPLPSPAEILIGFREGYS